MNLNKLFQFFRDLFTNRKKYLKLSIEIVNNIKKAVDSQLAADAVAIIPGTVDDVLLSKLRVIVTEVLTGLHLAERAIGAAAFKMAVEELIRVKKEERTGYYKAIAGDIYAKMVDIPLDIAIDLTQEEYRRNA